MREAGIAGEGGWGIFLTREEVRKGLFRVKIFCVSIVDRALDGCGGGVGGMWRMVRAFGVYTPSGKACDIHCA